MPEIPCKAPNSGDCVAQETNTKNKVRDAIQHSHAHLMRLLLRVESVVFERDKAILLLRSTAHSRTTSSRRKAKAVGAVLRPVALYVENDECLGVDVPDIVGVIHVGVLFRLLKWGHSSGREGAEDRTARRRFR